MGYKFVLYTQKNEKARDLLIQTTILPVELIIAKYLIKKFDTAWVESCPRYPSLHQNTQTKQFKVRQNIKTNFGMHSIARHCV